MADAPQGRLAIVGASARAAAFAALRAEWDVVSADLFADADLVRHVPVTRVAHYPGDLLSWLCDQRIDGWIYTGALENYPRLVDRMAHVTPLLGNAGPTLQAVRSPWRLTECLCEAGLSYPEVARASNGLPTDGSWLRKPLCGSGGAGIEPWLGQPQRHRRRMYWQRRASGTPCAALYVAARGDARLLGVTRQLVGTQWSGARPFQYAGSIGPWPTTSTQLDRIERIGRTLAAEVLLEGLFGVDLMLDNEIVWAIEVNPRYTAAAEVVERFGGVNPLAAHVEACRGMLPTPQCQNSLGRFHGKAILYSREEGLITQEFFEWSIERSGPVLSASLADVPAPGTQIHAGHPVLTVLAEGETPGRVEDGLRERVEEVRRALSRKRREGR